MMEDKPKEILELERALGIDHVDHYRWDGEKVTELRINSKGIKDISPISKFPFLERLDLKGNKIDDLTPISEFNKLYHLNLSKNQISNLAPLSGLRFLDFLELGQNKIEKLGALSNLSGLNYLGLFRNLITDISAIGTLFSLNELILNDNNIINIEPLGSLSALSGIYLHDNQIYDLSPLESLNNLFFVDLIKNNISDLRPLKRFIENDFVILLDRPNSQIYSVRRIILIGDNPLENPPISIIEKGSEAVLEYFKDLEKYGEFEILEAKLLITGEPKAGKTTLRKKIFDPDYKVPCEEEKETIGVQIQKGWNFPFSKDPPKTLTANIWDFGGQDRQYPLHQFFMDDVSCYVLVSDDRADNSNMDKWFGMIKLLGGTNSNVLVILNQINRSTPSSNFNKERYEKQGFTVETFSIDFSGDIEVVNILLENIKNRISNLEHIGQTLPKKICEPIRNEIIRLKESENKPYLTKEEYISACKNVNLKIAEEQEKALKYLKIIGDVIHFGEDYLVENIIVLNPIWLTQAIYATITEETLDEFHQKGIFTRDWFYDFMLSTTESKTISYTKLESNHILNFMLKNNLDICYTSDNQTFIIPLCMPEKLPDHHFDEKGGLIMLFRYETVPPGLVSRLIVRMSEYVDDSLVAKNAVILRKGQARAKIDEYFKEGDANKYLKIVVTGSNFDKYTLMNEIKSVLKEIKRQWFKNLVYSEEIPCTCVVCKDSPKPYFHNMELIRKKVNLGKTKIDCGLTGDEVNISGLLGHTSEKEFNELMDIRNILSELQEYSKVNAEFNMAFSDAFIEINETIMNIDGNTTKKPLSSLDKIFEKGKRVKDWVSILKVPTDSIDVVDKLLSYIEAYKEIVST